MLKWAMCFVQNIVVNLIISNSSANVDKSNYQVEIEIDKLDVWAKQEETNLVNAHTKSNKSITVVCKRIPAFNSRKCQSRVTYNWAVVSCVKFRLPSGCWKFKLNSIMTVCGRKKYANYRLERQSNL